MFSFPSRTSATGQLVVLLTGWASSGCSFVFVTPPPARAEQASQPNADCSTSRAAPVIDGIIAGYQVARTIYAMGAPDSAYQGNAPLSRGADIGLGLGFTGLFLASTIYGALNTSECSDFKARAEEQDLKGERERSTSQSPPPPRAKPAPPAVDEPATRPEAPVLHWGTSPADSAAPASSAAAPPAAPPATVPPAAPSAPKASGAFPAP